MAGDITYTLTLTVTEDPAGANALAEVQLEVLAEKVIEEVNIGMGGTTIKTKSLVQQ